MTAVAEITVRRAVDTLLVPAAALRFTPPAPESSDGSLLRGLLPRPPTANRRIPNSHRADSGQVWVMRDGVTVPVPVKVGDSNGQMTEVISEDLMVGSDVIVGLDAKD
jgi:HlyD family secretion protein